MGLFRQILFACIALITLASYSNASSVSGIYVQKFDGAIMFMQLIITPDSRVSGRGEFITMFPDGSLKNKSFSLEGDIDGNQISLKPSGILGLRLIFSGTVDGETLRLISDDGQMTLLKSDLDTFAQEKSKLAARGAAIATANKEAKFQAEAKDYLKKLTSEGQSLEDNLAKLPQAESDADKFIAQIKLRRDSIVNQIKILRAKIPLVSAIDGGVIGADIGGLQANLWGLKFEFDNNNRSHVRFGVDAYRKFRTSLENFKSHCDEWVSKYSPTLPPQCRDFQTYQANYKSSAANMNNKFSKASKMFVFD